MDEPPVGQTSPIRKERDRQRLRQLLLDGALSPQAAVVDDAFFDSLRDLAQRSS
jgi:antitoxin ParD1/3/4